MARIALVGKSEVFVAHLEQSKGERNNCAVRAVAAVTNTSYEVVHAIMARHGRKHGKGTQREIFWKTLTELGFRSSPRSPREFISRYPGSHASSRSLPRRLEGWQELFDLHDASRVGRHQWRQPRLDARQSLPRQPHLRYLPQHTIERKLI